MLTRIGRLFLPFLLLASIVAAGNRADAQNRIAQGKPSRAIVPSERDPLRREVIENLLNLPAGPGRVSDFKLPLAFLGRAADRILTAAFEEQFRKVVADGATSRPGLGGATPPASSQPATMPASGGRIRVVHQRVLPDGPNWQTMPEDYPWLRGFRAPLNLASVDGSTPLGLSRRDLLAWPLSLPAIASAAQREAAAIVARDLATRGLLATTASVLTVTGLVPAAVSNDDACRILRDVGLPVDLLCMFESRVMATTRPAPGVETAADVVGWIRYMIREDAPADVLAGELAAVPFKWRPTVTGWRASSESGDSTIDGLHLQMSRGDDWLAPGDGGCVDVAQQLGAALPDARMVASIQNQHLATFLDGASPWMNKRGGETWVLAGPYTVAQWAQDNCKFGWTDAGRSKAPQRVGLIPRFASRGEAGAVFVAGESAVMQGFAEAGTARVAQSPLLFQAGNLYCIHDPAKKERVLLIGEAEIYRNVALGLTQAQAMEAFEVEFGVDRCVMLPAASFHIDYEVCPRVVDGRVVALVNDEPTAARLVLQSAVDALLKAGDFTDAAAAEVTKAIADGTAGQSAELGKAFTSGAVGMGAFSLAFADKFSAGPADSGVGNFQIVCHALDLESMRLADTEAGRIDPALVASVNALRRRADERKALKATLKSLGWTVVPIPSMGDSKRALNYLNGIHDKRRFLMPAYGGVFEKVDQAAQAAVQKAFGPSVEIVPIRCAESQRREGAVRCSAAVMYAPQTVP